MSRKINVLYQNKPCYDIYIEDSFGALADALEPFALTDRKVCIITDSNVDPLYGAEVEDMIGAISGECVRYVFPAGEESKTLDTVREIYKFLIGNHFNRKDLLIALGGGVVGDLTGYTAATYLRGIEFIQIPTTLLSQADSSIGGKTGVDFDGYKNMVGAFYMPRLVYMNMETLQSLSDRQFYSGFAEVMKSALIKDGNFYEWLIDQMYEICERDVETLAEMVERSCMIKKLVVEKDPLEKGDRALLNFGHTIGHAIEKYMNFTMTHGECVALGCVAAGKRTGFPWKNIMKSGICSFLFICRFPLIIWILKKYCSLLSPIRKRKMVILNLSYLRRSVRHSLIRPLPMMKSAKLFRN